ncbi:putative Monocarboxylate transporter 2 [Hypsibius exemplaris]|uniref:Monocarboxylate transporter 2 n=1 Tax=Hypsibius exemplaris TaxID=2072580 RepID=A0A1W0X643_HYPEX|nr:putative Monocarboxylate transporter 2 [Hypsibius exemplaris]
MEVTPAPNGGFGWIVVFAAFMQHVLSLGVAYTLGIYYKPFLEVFPVLPSTAAWVAALHLGILFGIGPVAGWLMGKIGTSGVSFAGSLIAGLGCIGAAFATSIYVVIVCLGLISGIGTGFMFISSVTAVSRWFDTRRALATGLAVSGAGFGIFLFAPLVRLMLSHYGREGALLIEGGLAFQGCVFALLLRPLPRRSLRPVAYAAKKSSLTLQLREDRPNKLAIFDDEQEESIPLGAARRFSITENGDVPQPRTEKKQNMGDIVRNWMFWVFGFSQFLTFLSASGPLVFLYNRAVNDLSVEVMQAAYIISIMGIANTAGRLVFGALGNIFPRSRLFLLSGAIMTYGLATAISTLGTSFVSVALYAVVFGAGYGCMFALTTVVLVDHFGIELFGPIYGNIGIFRGFACIIGPPFAGWLISVTGANHTILFILKGSLGFCGGAALLLIPIVKRIRS